MAMFEILVFIVGVIKYAESNMSNEICGVRPELCPDGWSLSNVNGVCYKLYQTALSYVEAESLCAGVGGAIMNSWALPNARFILFGAGIAFSGKIWIGAEYDGQSWVWPDGTMIPNTNWANNEPDQLGTLAQMDIGGQWYAVDEMSTTADSVVCQRPSVCKMKFLEVRNYAISDADNIQEEGAVLTIHCIDGKMREDGLASTQATCSTDAEEVLCKTCNVDVPVVTCEILDTLWGSCSLEEPNSFPSTLTEGDTLLVSCTEGLYCSARCSTNQYIECQEDGNISCIPCQTKLECVTCDIPTDFWSSNSLVELSGSPSSLSGGSTLTVSCIDGLYLDGCATTQEVECIVDGSISVISCLTKLECVTCDIPTDFWSSNSLVELSGSPSSLSGGSTLTVSCTDGLYLDGCATTQEVECIVDGSISVISCLTILECVNCDIPNEVWSSNSLVAPGGSPSSLTGGSKLTVSCVDGLYLDGCAKTQEVECMVDGTISVTSCQTILECVICDIPNDFWISNSLVELSGSPSSLSGGSTLTVSCADGLYLNGCTTTQEVQCEVDGIISVISCQTILTCVTCDIPNDLWSSYSLVEPPWLPTSLSGGSSLTVGCTDGLYLDGCATTQGAECMVDGSISVISCQTILECVICDIRNDLWTSNSLVKPTWPPTSLSGGSTYQASCPDGLYLVGCSTTQDIECMEDGSISVISCQTILECVICNIPNDIWTSYSLVEPTWPPTSLSGGSTYQATCADGLYLDGCATTQEIECMVDGSIPVISCQSVLSCASCHIDADFWSTNNLQVPSVTPTTLSGGDTLTVTCANGFELTDCAETQTAMCIADGSISVTPCQSQQCCALSVLNYKKLNIKLPSVMKIPLGDDIELECTKRKYLPKCVKSQYVKCNDDDIQGMPQLTKPIKCSCKGNKCDKPPSKPPEPCLPILCPRHHIVAAQMADTRGDNQEDAFVDL